MAITQLFQQSLMASFGYKEIIISLIFLLFLYTFLNTKRGHPINWPFLGMIPTLTLNSQCLHDKLADILEETGGTFLLKGFWLTNTDKIITCDPDNIEYAHNEKFDNFEKGEEAKQIWEYSGDFLFNADHDEWRKDRNMMRAFFSDRRYTHAANNITSDILEKGVMPVLEHVVAQGEVVDLQDLFRRLMIDSLYLIATGYNPNSLSIGSPESPLSIAMAVFTDGVVRRSLVPSILWRAQRWLDIGGEKVMGDSLRTFNDIVKKYIEMKGEDIKGQVKGFDALKFFMTDDHVRGSKTLPYNVLRDIVLIITGAGQDTSSLTLTWLMWLVSKNPKVEAKIRQELKEILPQNESENVRLFTVQELSKLPYLHATFCETLRLYPPAPLQKRVAVQPDILPSGHHVKRKLDIVFSFYALGRMKSIWGNDSLEFKPERWMSENGEFRQELANKYLMAFSTGPRVCPGKNDAFSRMKPVAAFIIHNFNVQVAEGHNVITPASVILRMENGLKVNITKRKN